MFSFAKRFSKLAFFVKSLHFLVLAIATAGALLERSLVC